MVTTLLQPPASEGPLLKRLGGPLLCFGLLVTALACDVAMAEPDAGASINPSYESTVEAPSASGSESDVVERLDIDISSGSIEQRVERVLAAMTVNEKIGQLCQRAAYGEEISESIAADLRAGRIGSLFYTGSAKQTREAKRIAREESRLGLPLLTPRDVIHGFRTVFPIPLGQAASWNPELIREAAAVAAREAKAEGVNWTFAPMLDISRDARWGRIAESLGEDPLLAATIAEAMVRGYQGGEDGEPPGIAACAKHFVAYGLSEGGRDYNRVQVATNELHNMLLAPFQAAVDAECATVMTSFNTVNGVPGTGHAGLVGGVLKRRWGFDGLVVSDWGSVIEMIEHGYAEDEAEAGELALRAGVDMEMATTCFQDHLADLLDTGRVSNEQLDDAVRRVLRIKFRYALEEAQAQPPAPAASEPDSQSLELARRLAQESIVLLKNEGGLLPLKPDELTKVAVIGPLADAARDQLGCWMLDGKPEEAITPLAALRSEFEGQAEVRFAAGLKSSIDEGEGLLAEAIETARWADVVVLCVGEEYWLSGEARCRADLDLPGRQSELVEQVVSTDTPTVLVTLAGRPLTIGEELSRCDASLFAWHPGTMGGPALVDLLLGEAVPSGKLPVTFPKHVGQSPLYYNHPRTGRPPLAGTAALIGSDRADFPEEQKYRSHYLDVDPFPLLPFGFGLSYTSFEYSEVELSVSELKPGQTLGVRVRLTNSGEFEGEEVAQLYVRDVAAKLVRPVRELKAFRRVRLKPGESRVLEFALDTEQLSYYDNSAQRVIEPGVFRVGVGGDSTAPLEETFRLVIPEDSHDKPQRAVSTAGGASAR